MAAGEAVDPALEDLLGAAGGEHHPQALDRALAERLRQGDEHGDPAEVVVGPGDDRAAGDVREQRGRRRRERRPGGGQPAAAGGGAERGQRRPGGGRPTRPGSRCRSARSPPGTRSTSLRCSVWSKARPPWAASWWARATKVRSASGSPTLGDHVPGRLALGDARRSGRNPLETSSASSAAAAAPPATAAVRARPLSAAIARGDAGAGERGEQVREAVEELLLLDPAPSAPARRRRAASHSAASRSPSEPGLALERRQGLDHLAQRLHGGPGLAVGDQCSVGRHAEPATASSARRAGR